MMQNSVIDTLDCSSMNFLRQNPLLADALFSECNYDISQVRKLLQATLQAPKRCQLTPFFIQAVLTHQTAFLTTNLNQEQQEVHLRNVSSVWLIGRDKSCAITVPGRFVSRCHAVIAYTQERGFYVADVGSSNGTLVNRRRLHQNQRGWLKDGDLIQFGDLQVEFFLSTPKPILNPVMEATR